MSCFIFTFLVILWDASKCVTTEDLLLFNFLLRGLMYVGWCCRRRIGGI